MGLMCSSSCHILVVLLCLPVCHASACVTTILTTFHIFSILFIFACTQHTRAQTHTHRLALSCSASVSNITFDHFFRFIHSFLLLLFPFHLIFMLNSCNTLIDLGSNFVYFLDTLSTHNTHSYSHIHTHFGKIHTFISIYEGINGLTMDIELAQTYTQTHTNNCNACSISIW